MKFFRSIFRRNPARELALIGARQRKTASKQLVHDKVDQMRASMGMEPVQWPGVR